MRGLAVLIALLAAPALAGGVQTRLDAQAATDAVTEGRRSGRERSRFHDPYRVLVAVAPIDFVEVLTPFRRVVIETHARYDAGERSFGQRQALDMLAAGADRLDVQIELTFHPLNTFLGVPGYEVALLSAAGRPLQPLALERIPRWTPRVSGTPYPGQSPRGGASAPAGQPLLGGTMLASFDLTTLDPSATYTLVVRDGRETVGRATLNLARMR